MKTLKQLRAALQAKAELAQGKALRLSAEADLARETYQKEELMKLSRTEAEKASELRFQADRLLHHSE
ncbi:MAG: hypothetical protein H0X25_23475 [Acidobacteriales bacterium]|nr:hypothetical protein [Terriglobales bacterium]